MKTLRNIALIERITNTTDGAKEQDITIITSQRFKDQYV